MFARAFKLQPGDEFYISNYDNEKYQVGNIYKHFPAIIQKIEYDKPKRWWRFRRKQIGFYVKWLGYTNAPYS